MKIRRIVSDVGGTNVRFAACDEKGRLSLLLSRPSSAFASFDSALADYFATQQLPRSLELIVAAAGPVIDGCIKLTNSPWIIDRDAIARWLGHSSVVLVNDLEAVAAALPHLAPSQLRALGAVSLGRNLTGRTMLALNVGTGFGAASAILRGGRWWTCPSEAGHMSISLALEGVGRLDATIEDFLSGIGMVRLYADVAGTDYDPRNGPEKATEIFDRADDEAAIRTVAVFNRMMGRIAGDLVLATAAWGGVFFSGSVARRWAEIADVAAFRASFEDKGRMTERMRHVPTASIDVDDVALSGMAMMALEDLKP